MASDKLMALPFGPQVAQAGFDPQWVSNMIDKYGASILQLLWDGIQLGFSKEWLTEVVNKGEPLLIGMLQTFLGAQMQAKAKGLLGGGAVEWLHGPIAKFFVQQLIMLVPTVVSDPIQAQMVVAVLNAVLIKMG